MECVYCSKTCKNSNSLRNHQRLCKKNPNRQIFVSNLISFNKLRKENNVKGTNQYLKAEKLGLPKPKVSEETKKKITDKTKNRIMSDAEKTMRSHAMKMAVEKYPESYSKNNVCGRVKIIEYNGVKLKGSWELLVAKWLDENNITWQHEVQTFSYKWNGDRTYFPDFYLPEEDLYIEVKGYKTDRDDAKWKSVPNLLVIGLKEIKEIKNKTFGPLSALAHNELKP